VSASSRAKRVSLNLKQLCDYINGAVLGAIVVLLVPFRLWRGFALFSLLHLLLRSGFVYPTSFTGVHDVFPVVASFDETLAAKFFVDLVFIPSPAT